MNNIWFFSLISVFLISLISFVGLIFLALKKEILQKLMLFLVSFATGGLLGSAFLHLLPEAVEELGLGWNFSLMILGGILAFFVLEKFILWRHCHIPISKKNPQPLVFMNLVGDGFHNFLDGVMIAASFMTDFSLGIVTTIAVLIHEIPQEIGDFGILVYGGFSKTKALFFNFASGLIAVLGAVLTLSLGAKFTNFIPLLIPFTAGGFIYIASSDLIPELKKETKPLKSLLQFFGLLLGIGLMMLLAINE
jgi:zinc and cadmium transporter